MGAIAKRLGIRTTDGCLFPYTDLTAKQPDMRPWNGPMETEWLIDSRDMRVKRLKWLETDLGGAPRIIERGKPFSIATAEKEDLLEYVLNEFGSQLDARLPVLILRRQALSMANKQLEEMEAAEQRKNAPEAAVAPAVSEAVSPQGEAPQETQAAAEPARARGLGRRAA